MIVHNGKEYARVSDILKQFNDFSGINEEVLRVKAALGTNVHDAIDDDIQGNYPAVLPNGIGYFESFQKWRSHVCPTFIESEVRYYDDKRMITGRIDALVKLQGENEAVLTDFKTSAQESPITWPMQAHLYYHLLTMAGKKVAPRFLFLKLDKYGNLPKVFEYKLCQNILNKCYNAIDEFWERLESEKK